MHWTNPDNPADPKAWLSAATEHKGSWWEDWTAWIAERAGAKRDTPALGSAKHKRRRRCPREVRLRLKARCSRHRSA